MNALKHIAAAITATLLLTAAICTGLYCLCYGWNWVF